MKNILLIIALISHLTSFSQTKLIAHKGHSGKISTFQQTLVDRDANTMHSNYGRAPMRRIQNAALDTVIFVSPKIAVVITSHYCVDTDMYSDTTVWQAGRDTVYDHPLFSQQHALDSIKKVLKEKYHFKNSIDQVVFIGYDNGKAGRHQHKRKNEILPVGAYNIFPPSDKQIAAIAGLILIVSLLGGLYSRKLQTPKI